MSSICKLNKKKVFAYNFQTERKRCMMNNRNMTMSILILLSLLAPCFTKPLYYGLGPSYGYYRTGDSDGWNDRIGVGSRLRYPRWGAEVEVHYKNEYYFNDRVWVKSWPITASALFYPFKIFYVGAGIGSYELYIDYNQSAPGLENLENESKRRTGLHICTGIESNLTKTSAAAFEIRYCRIEYHLADLPGFPSVDTNALSLKVTVFFKLGIEP
jgi:hypothetical protein